MLVKNTLGFADHLGGDGGLVVDAFVKCGQGVLGGLRFLGGIRP
jgi:hypothetical protein